MNIENPLTLSENIQPQIKKVTSFLDKVVRTVAGKQESQVSNLSDSEKAALHSSPDTKKNLRYHAANAVHNIAHNNSGFIDKLNAGLSSIYLAGAVVGKPLEGVISGARRIEQGANLLRRFATGAKINSPSRMLAAFMGLPALLVKNVGEGMYLLNGFQSGAGNFAEAAMESAKESGVMEDGIYKNFLDEPKALIKKLGNSIGELAKNPSLVTDMKWLEKSQFLALGNMAGTAMLGLGLLTKQDGIARTGRNLQSMVVDADKFSSDNIERSASGIGFGTEMALDTLNASKFDGNSTRLSAGVALAGQVARTLGNVYQDTKFDASLPKIYTNPVGFFQKAIPSILKYANPVSLMTRAKKDLSEKFENILGTAKPVLETIAAPEDVSPTVEMKAPEALAQPVLTASKANGIESKSYTTSYENASETNEVVKPALTEKPVEVVSGELISAESVPVVQSEVSNDELGNDASRLFNLPELSISQPNSESGNDVENLNQVDCPGSSSTGDIKKQSG